MAEFKYFDLKLVEPIFNSHLIDLIIDLDYLRKKPLGGTTHPVIFFQLKNIFHTLESIGSARIEGNRTTLAEYIETKISQEEDIKDEKIIEIQNMEKAMEFIDNNIKAYPINRMFLSELHKMVVIGLSPEKEGDQTPGEYRMKNVSIMGAAHKPPDYTQVSTMMQELLDFIAFNHPSKYDLLKTAIAHHRFVWVHPFGNGNGRTVRLFTYAMLVKQGFNVDVGRIINPTAIFCSDRNKYYQFLSAADRGTSDGMLEWCFYVLSGLKSEIEKIDRLLDYKYLSTEILMPAVRISLERKVITDDEAKILNVAIAKQVFQAGDLTAHFPGKVNSVISRMIRQLREKRMIVPEKDNTRKYVMSFNNNYLLRGIIAMLGQKNFLPIKDEA